MTSTPIDLAKPGDRPPAREILRVEDLKVHFPVRTGWFGHRALKAVDGVSLTVNANETLGLVGESGSGKSTVARAIVRIERATGGTISITGNEPVTDEVGLRRTVQMIFQDPRASLDPRQTIGDAIEEPLIIHKLGDRSARSATVTELLDLVGLPGQMRDRMPGSLSGGQLQRVAIARALAVRPNLLLCDEAVSALDVSIQAQIVNLLRDLQAELGIGYLFIAHDLAVVQNISHRVGVMYLGSIMEIGGAADVISRPLHPYTRALVDSVPETTTVQRKDRLLLRGDIPSPLNVPSGCRFRTRCPWAQDRCATVEPALRSVAGYPSQVACHFAEEIASEKVITD